jgi:NADH dehydrogenase
MVDGMEKLVVVTGAAGFTGKHIASAFLNHGYEIRSLVSNLNRPDPFQGKVRFLPYQFDDYEALKANLKGARSLINTYWVRFNYGEVNFDRAVENSRRMFQAAREAGVERIVHISVTNPSADPQLPYFRGKWILEQELIQLDLSYAVIRPTLIFGPADILINNIAYLLRKLPVFVIPGDGEYRLQPISIQELSDMVVRAESSSENLAVDAAGPKVYSYNEMVKMISRAVGSRSLLVHLPPRLAVFLARLIGCWLRDILITDDEIAGLMMNKLVSGSPPTGQVSFSDWLSKNKSGLGKSYSSELARNYQ